MTAIDGAVRECDNGPGSSVSVYYHVSDLVRGDHGGSEDGDRPKPEQVSVDVENK